jgi:hypothetical protein
MAGCPAKRQEAETGDFQIHLIDKMGNAASLRARFLLDRGQVFLLQMMA